jgi:hypothetical protein
MADRAPLVSGPLVGEQIEQFIQRGFVLLAEAFARSLADHCRDLLWTQTGLDPEDASTWTRPVLRLPGSDAAPFVRAANSPRLLAAFDQLVGHGRWYPRPNLGTFPIRFPSSEDPGDAGWHIPTRIRVGSHLDVPGVLEAAGKAGLPFQEIVPRLPRVHERPVALATGRAGDVYLCHPFLVHAATWPHRGRAPRFIAQPPLTPVGPLQLERADGDYSAVEIAVRLGLGLVS